VGSGSPDSPVILCFDGSDGSRHALVEAARLLQPGPALAVTVRRPASTAGTVARPTAPGDPVGVGRETAREGAELARAAGWEAEPLVVETHESVADAIVELAEERRARAVVVGSRGLSGVRSMLLGSVSRAVADSAHRPVLVIPPPVRAEAPARGSGQEPQRITPDEAARLAGRTGATERPGEPSTTPPDRARESGFGA
jgi:nucleotide-binding universal stress UspA family protein